MGRPGICTEGLKDRVQPGEPAPGIVIGAVGLPLYAALVQWRAPEVWDALRDRVAAALRRRVPA